MPNIFEVYNNQVNKQNQSQQAPVSEQGLESFQEDNQKALQEDMNNQPEKGLSLDGNFSGNEEQNERNKNTMYSNNQLGTTATKNTRDTYEDPNSWSPEYSDRGFMEEAGTSIMRGVGNHLIKGTGDMLQVAAGFVSKDLVRGNMLSTLLQDAGTDMADKFKSFMPEELQHENLTWSSAMNPKFWSTHVAEMIPQLAEFIFISKGGAGLAKLGLKGVVKNLPGKVAKTALGKVIPGTAKGIAGKLGTDIGLTTLGQTAAGAVGGGLAGNAFSGLLNAAEVVNSNKDLVDAQGNKVFTDDELYQMAAGTMKHNAAWVGLDMVSWGMTFGGGYKALKGLNPVSKGAKLWNRGQQSKIASKMFSYEMSPIIKGLGRVAGKAGAEGFEEMYQESWEEWAKKKAKFDVTGEPITADGKEIGNELSDFYTFFKSKENEATKVLSAAVGALGGGVFNISSLVNKKADDAYKMYDRARNIAEITEKQGSNKELEWQQYHIQDTIADIVIDGKEDAYNDFMNHLEENGNINPEEKQEYDKMFLDFKETKSKAERLNVKGEKALLHNKAIENVATRNLARYEELSKQKVLDIQSEEGMDERTKAKEIAKAENDFNTKMKAQALMIAEAKQNQSNLIIGKLATPLEMNVVTNEWGVDMTIGGLSTEQVSKYTKEGDTKKASEPLSYGKLKDTGKSIYNKILGMYDSAMESDIVKNAKDGIQKGKDKVDAKFDEATDLERNKLKDDLAQAENDIAKANEVYEAAVKKRTGSRLSRPTKEELSLLDGVAEKRNEAKEALEVYDNKKAGTHFARQNETGGYSIYSPEGDKVGRSYGDKKSADEEVANLNKDISQKADEQNEQEVEKDVEPDSAIDDDVWNTYQTEGTVTPQLLNEIARKVNDKEKLSPREEEIRQQAEEEISERITKKILGTDKETSTDPISVKDEEVQIKEEQNPDDETLTDKENQFVKAEVIRDEDGKAVKDVQAERNEKALKSLKVDPNKMKGAEGLFGMDKRSKPTKNVFSINRALVSIRGSLLNKIRNHNKIKETDQISQSELDNYLNTFTTYNLLGPDNIHKMAVVNHRLKRMFPNTNEPTQVIVVRNLFESVGSQGLGYSLAGTIYIDEKAWEQDNVFMHEMSHIYYQLSKDTPEVQKLIKASLLNKELVKEIKTLYDDYTQYTVIDENGVEKTRTKGEIFNHLRSIGYDENGLNDVLTQGVKDGYIKTVPLSEQSLLVEEMFVAQLEGPLSAKFDKTFNTKNEVQRQADVKKFWGLIRKKGAIIEQNDGVDNFLRELSGDEVPKGSIENFIFDTFKAVTKGVTFDAYGLDARAKKTDAEYNKSIEEIKSRKSKHISNSKDYTYSSREEQDAQDNYDDELEENGEFSFDSDFNTHVKSATKIFRRFGVIYNKALRRRFLNQTKDDVVNRDMRNIATFDKSMFESTLYNLAIENNNSNDFIYNIEHSALNEVKAFNRYLETMHPDTKLSLLNSMHLVLSNSKHIVGFRNTKNEDGTHSFVDSLSTREIAMADNVVDGMKDEYGSPRWKAYYNAVKNIYMDPVPQAKDIRIVMEFVAPTDFRFDKVIEQGTVTFKGNTIGFETLIAGFVKKGLLFNTKADGTRDVNSIYYANARPLVEALISTNRKFTPLSSVLNAEGNMEPVRITNNHLTKEIDNIIAYLAPDEKGNKKTKGQFLKRYGHLSTKGLKKKGKNYYNADGTKYVPNQFLENIYDQYQQGIMPTVSQYHGLEDESNKEGSLYKNSTSLEQGIEDLLTFVRTSTKETGGKNATYLANMGAFSDSPRKFFMNSKRIAYDEVFSGDGKASFNSDGKIINSIYNLHKKLYPGNPNAKKGSVKHRQYQVANSKALFRKEFKKSISETIAFINDNAEQLQGVKVKVGYGKKGKVMPMSRLFSKTKNGLYLNKEGQKIAAEFAINSIVNGYNMAEVFAPNIDGVEITKRFKLNTSPVVSVKNPNFKIEPLFFADEIVNNSISGTDSGMYILEEDAKMFQDLGKGVFEMNNGFKFLNASVEKENSKLKGKTAYLKGYTTIVGETHPLYKAMRARKDKYLKHYEEVHGEGAKPSSDLSDGTDNHIVLAIPQSSDKSNFSGKKFIDKNKDADGNEILEYNEQGAKFTEAALAENIDELNKHNDEMYYDKKGKFIGIESYNFGPQQLFDKQSKTVNTPVQMVNSIIVNATLNGKLKEAYEIQDLIVAQKQANLQKVLDKLKTNKDKTLAQAYKRLVNDGLNKQDMDQAQRILFEDESASIAHPYLVDIITNQLAKTLRKAGNKLNTEGTLAHQKSDTGWRTQSVNNKSLKGYGKRGDGGLIPGEMVLPKHMINESNAKAREHYTIYNSQGKGIIERGQKNWSKSEKSKNELIQRLNILQFAALQQAENRHNVTRKEAFNYIGEIKDKNRIVIGYHVKGDTVIATRVPSDGPSSTGVFEVVGYDKGEGNQVMVSSEFNDILGSDNDGDALFIQTKTKAKGYENWNKAFKKITEYWTSPEMAEQVTTKMVFEESTEKVIEQVQKVFPQSKDYVQPFSPKARMTDYNNTMVSKRNVGPVFNIHKMTNLLGSVDTNIVRGVKIGKNEYGQFTDNARGNESRNQQSAILANIILDNAKHGYADALGLNEHNISQAVLMVNLGVPLDQVGLILNSPAAKLWSELNRNNSSMFHDYKSKPEITKQVFAILSEANGLWKTNKKGKLEDYIPRAKANMKNSGHKSAKRPKGKTNIDIANIADFKAQNNILETLDYLADMNSEIQKLSTIMGGHKKIHVNPLVLEQQIKEFDEVIRGRSEEKTLVLNDNFKANPDMKHYRAVAEETLTHLQRINPVYREATNKVLTNLKSKINKDLSSFEIEQISRDLLKFNTSRLLGLNNKSISYVENLMSQDPKNKESIFNKLNEHLKILRTDVVYRHPTDITKSWSMFDNSVLFKQAMSIRINNTNDPDQKSYISANAQFTNDSFNEVERIAAQEEFESLSPSLREDLILYDMITRGWKGPISLSPFFSKDTNWMVNYASDEAMGNKNQDISPVVTKRLEKIIALKQSKSKNNSLTKFYLSGNEKAVSATNEVPVLKRIFEDETLMSQIQRGQPMYINVINNSKNQRELYELEAFTDEEIGLINSENSNILKRQRTALLAKDKLKHIPYDLHNAKNGGTDVDLALIPDKNIMKPFNVFPKGKGPKSLEYMKKASIGYEQAMASLRANSKSEIKGMDAREDFYDETFAKQTPLTFEEYQRAMEFKTYVSESIKKGMYNEYEAQKKLANKEAETALAGLENKSSEQLLSMYNNFGKKDAYAYAIITTPVVKQLAKVLIKEQGELMAKNGVKPMKEGGDISLMKAYMISGSTIPSNHPAAQGMARMMEKEYKNFINEKKKYVNEMNTVTDALYKEKLGYGGVSGLSIQGIKNLALRVKDALFSNRTDIYESLYGNLVVREEVVNDQNKLVTHFKLRPQSEIDNDFNNGTISKAEKDFYDYFKKTTNELMPKSMKGKVLEDYIPHTAMGKLEAFSSRGLLGLLANSRSEDHAIQDVKLMYEGELMSFKTITDHFKRMSAGEQKNDTRKALEYRKLKSKANKLLKSGNNEDGSPILTSAPFTETVLGFGAINRFANNRSVKATELPSMDLNKALGDYIHSSLFVNGNENFKGMEKLQGYIDGVLAWNTENNLPKMNDHIQKVWKDYFLRQKRQTSALGETGDRVIRGLTRMNLFYALGYNANLNTGGLYAIGNVLAGKYHNIKDIGAGAWLKGESRFWGLDQGMKGGLKGVAQRMKRMSKIMKTLNFMEINVYDEVSMEQKGGLDKIFTDIALGPMIYSEKWIQNVHMLGLLSEEQMNKFDEEGNYKENVIPIDNYDLTRIEDQVKSSHGRGYQPTDQRAIQMYSWGTMMLQFSRFIPTMVHDRFAKEDVNIYGRETIGTMTAVGKMLKYVMNNPKDFVAYRKSLTEEQRRRLDSGLKGVAMSAIVSMATSTSDTANSLFWDVNYYWNYPKLTSKIVPAPIQSASNLVNGLF